MNFDSEAGEIADLIINSSAMRGEIRVLVGGALKKAYQAGRQDGTKEINNGIASLLEQIAYVVCGYDHKNKCYTDFQPYRGEDGDCIHCGRLLNEGCADDCPWLKAHRFLQSRDQPGSPDLTANHKS